MPSDPEILFQYVYPKELKQGLKYLYTVFTAAFFTLPKRLKIPDVCLENG